MVKSRDDLRLEGVVMQALRLMKQIWTAHEVPIYVRPYSIVCCGEQCGLLENVATAKSLDSIKKGTGAIPLVQFFAGVFCTPQAFHDSQLSFMRSLVPYSILTYIFQVSVSNSTSYFECVCVSFGHSG